jgi:hypothetical protein
VTVVRRHVPDPALCVPAQRVGNLLFRSCCLRFESLVDGPYIHVDATSHACVGVAEVRVQDTGRVDVIAAPGDLGRIGAVHVTNDETFAVRGMFVGPSGGAALTVLKFATRSGVQLDGLDADLYGPGRNFWLSWWSVLAGS